MFDNLLVDKQENSQLDMYSSQAKAAGILGNGQVDNDREVYNCYFEAKMKKKRKQLQLQC